MKIVTALLIFLALAWPDGILIPDSTANAYGHGQVALLKFANGLEQLYLLVTLSTGDSNGRTAWLVPLPGQPTAENGGKIVFEELSRLSAPVREAYGYYGCDDGLDCDGGYYGEAPEYAPEYFDLISMPQLVGLTTVVIHTNDADSLRSWLVNNGFTIPAGAPALFQEYIDKDWTYFFAAKTDAAARYYAGAVGIKLTFATTEPVYPMKISSGTTYLNYNYYGSGTSSIPLYLYVITDNKMVFDNAQLEYANDLTAEEITEIAGDMPTLGSLLAPGDFITKLHREYGSASQMSEDIILKQAPDNDEYRELLGERNYYYYGNATLWLIVLYPCYLAYRRVRRALRRKRTRSARR